MDISESKSILQAKLTNEQFTKLSGFIYQTLGIRMTDVKKTMLESRLQKRLRYHSITDFSTYIDLVFSKEGQATELVHMLDVVTTNKTDFFREPIHFDYLRDIVIPEFVAKHGFKTLTIWSAGCSSGEEPYTLAIVLQDEVKKGTIPDFSILATDISTHILQKAIDAIYPFQRIENIPYEIKRKYFLKNKNPQIKTARVNAELRSKVQFLRYNFMDAQIPFQEMFDVVFCRNVIIYFDRATQEVVLNRLCSRIKTDGFLFLGHSESITNMKVPVTNVKPTVFRKR